MPNKISRIPRTSRPEYKSREVAILLDSLTCRLEEKWSGGPCTICADQAPTASERERLTARRGELVDGLSPGGNLAAIAIAVANMFHAFPMVQVPGDKYKDILTAYTEQLKHLPLWAVETGCRSAAARNAPFPPNAGELRAICDALLQPYHDEQAAIRKVLEAEVYAPNPPAERERVKAGFQTLLAEFHKTSDTFGRRSANRENRK